MSRTPVDPRAGVVSTFVPLPARGSSLSGSPTGRNGAVRWCQGLVRREIGEVQPVSEIAVFDRSEVFQGERLCPLNDRSPWRGALPAPGAPSCQQPSSSTTSWLTCLDRQCREQPQHCWRASRCRIDASVLACPSMPPDHLRDAPVCSLAHPGARGRAKTARSSLLGTTKISGVT